jgi:aryl-alcohol dehydrogenase-like predicted oxidoreductase
LVKVFGDERRRREMSEGSTIPTARLGGLEVPAIGLGCLGMSELRGPADRDESLATLRRCVELGVTFFDTSNIYGIAHHSELLLAEAFRGRMDEVTIATKFGIVRDPANPSINKLPGAENATSLDEIVDGRPEYVRACAEGSMKRLGIDVIDLYIIHRVDPKVPIEETVGALSELVHAGLVREIGISEASTETIRRAHATHPLAAVQSEWSLWTRGIEDEVLGVCRELGIGVVPYCPLGRGFLTGTMKPGLRLDAGDFRQFTPWFKSENYELNLRLAEKVIVLAREKGVTPAQLALAWLLAQGDDVVPIPGTKRRAYLEENVGAADVHLTAADLLEIETAVPKGAAAGDRYVNMTSVNV